jgi:cytochrome oxidase Cu insertion factor (SCO1/SenC/PrrC family)
MDRTHIKSGLSLLLAALFLLFAFGVFAGEEEKDYEPFPDAMTGKKAPAYTMQGVYGETYSSADAKDAPVVLIFGTSW